MKKLVTLFAALLILALPVLGLGACSKDGVSEETKAVTVYLGEEALSVETRQDKINGLLKELLEAQKISAYKTDGFGYGIYVTQIGALVGDSAAGTYIAFYHDINDYALQDYAEDYSAITEEIGGKTVFYSGVGVALLPVVDGASYYFAVKSF
jgi:hypothetical protein